MRSLLLALALLVGGQASAQTTAPITSVTTTSALEASHVLKAGPGNLASVYVSALTGGTSGFLLMFNSTTVPADGSVVGCSAPAVSGCLVDCAPFGGTPSIAGITNTGIATSFYSIGITAVISSGSTCLTKTTGTLTGYIVGKVQ
jgi:hypothetical protein